MKNRLDELVEDYKVAVKNNDESKVKELEKFFKEKIGLTPLGLQIVAFG